MDDLKKTLEDLLRENFGYNPETGILTRIKKNGRHLANLPVGSVNQKGYLIVPFRKKRIFAHRLAWFFMHGAFPEESIDHINGNKKDNRAINLREVDDRTNKENQRKANSHNKSTGILGVSLHKASGRFTAQIHHNRKKIHLGYFADAQAAHGAYLDAKRKIHAGCMI